MSKLVRLAVFAAIVCVFDPLSIASAPPSKKLTTSKSKSAPSSESTTGNKASSKKKRSNGQELAKEFKEKIQKTGSLTGKHHPFIDSAIKSAKARRKQLLVVFVTKQCPHCIKLQKETLEQRQFQDRFLKDFNVCVIDCDKQRDVAEHYLYDPKVPHSKIINTSGQIVRQITGYSDDEKYAEFLAAK